MDLCLSCKACKSECPTNVDIATYRAEFLSHYYEGRLRPLHGYAFGMIDRWARLASAAPRLVNLLNTAPGISQLIRGALQIAPARAMPVFAPVSFRTWARRSGVPLTGKGRDRQVILWVDTFNNYFRPEVSQAALEVLRAAGFSVTIPRVNLCCGRPLYDFGFLNQAKSSLTRILDVLAREIDAGLPIVVLEPSCASVFRDELRNLFPDDARADRLRRQVFLLSEILERHAPGFVPPRMSGDVLLHGHCHHKAILKMGDEESLLRKMNGEVRVPDAGCCGMAGPFGFAKDKYDVSQAVGERVLFPAVRNARPETVIVADGFSCQEQIYQGTGRRAVHLAEAIQAALHR
jgi:Fe-S oxidoreductase